MPVDAPLCTAKSNKSITVFLFEQVKQAESGLPVDGVVQLALGMQPAHALFAVSWNQRFLMARVARPFVRADRLFFQLGFLMPYFISISFLSYACFDSAIDASWRMYRLSGVWSYAIGRGLTGSIDSTASYSRRKSFSCFFV